LLQCISDRGINDKATKTDKPSGMLLSCFFELDLSQLVFTGATERPARPKDQEPGPFDPCMSVQECDNDIDVHELHDRAANVLMFRF
jgi:hypothetical protein